MIIENLGILFKQIREKAKSQFNQKINEQQLNSLSNEDESLKKESQVAKIEIALYQKEIQQRENYIKIQQRIFDTHHKILEHSYTTNLKELLTKSLDEIEILLDSSISFFHFIEKDQNNILLQTWSTNTKTHFCEIKGEENHYPLGMQAFGLIVSG